MAVNQERGGVNINPDDYRCAVCQDTLVTLEPIRMCIRGHNFHQNCLHYYLIKNYQKKPPDSSNLSKLFDTREIKCPTCKEVHITSRNLMLEQIFTLYPIKCRNFNCEFITKCNESKSMEQHEKTCLKRDYLSSYSHKKFKWTERLKFLVNEINGFNIRDSNSVPPLMQEMQPATDDTVDFMIIGKYEKEFNSGNNHSIKLSGGTPNLIVFDLRICVALHAAIWKEEMLTQRIHVFNPLGLKFKLKYSATYIERELDETCELKTVSHNNVKLFDIEINGDRYVTCGFKRDIPSYYTENSVVEYTVSLELLEPIGNKNNENRNELLTQELSDISNHATLYLFPNNVLYNKLDDFLYDNGFKKKSESDGDGKTTESEKDTTTIEVNTGEEEDDNESENKNLSFDFHEVNTSEEKDDNESENESENKNLSFSFSEDINRYINDYTRNAY